MANPASLSGHIIISRDRMSKRPALSLPARMHLESDRFVDHQREVVFIKNVQLHPVPGKAWVFPGEQLQAQLLALAHRPSLCDKPAAKLRRDRKLLKHRR